MRFCELMGEKKIGSLIVTITLLAARLQHLANPSKASPCYWVPARGCLTVSNWFQARISRNKQFISSHLAVISRDQQAIGVNGPSCRQRRCVCPAKSKASAFKRAINTIKGKGLDKLVQDCVGRTITRSHTITGRKHSRALQ